MLIADGFEKHLWPHGPRELDAEAGSVVGLWPDGRIGFLNEAWSSFARDNRGEAVLTRWPLGSEIWSGISGVLRDYYVRAFERVRTKGEPWEQTYLCDAPWRRREFRLRVLPLEGKALLLLHSLVVDTPRFEAAAEPNEPREYVSEDGTLRQCSNCRRTQRVRGPHGWDWVRSYIAQAPANALQGICTTCVRQFYPEL
jgi:hypothetical protein